MKPIRTLYLVQLYRILARNSTFMAVKSSSSHTAMESPFSHMDMYGCDHPASSRVREKSKTSSKSGKGGGKRAKSSIRSAISAANSRSAGSTVSAVSSSSSKHKKKTGSRTSPKVSIPAKNGIIRNGNETEIRITSGSITSDMTEVAHNSPVLRKPERTGHTSHQLHTRNGAWRHSKNGLLNPVGKKSSLNPSTISKSLSSSLTASKKSLLAQSTSTMSTSEVLLRFNKDLGKSGSIDCSANVRINRTVKNVNLPPHMHLQRRAFDTDSKGGRGQGSPANGTAKSGPLTIRDIGMGLGKMQYRNVIVMSGAGISTASGIPDFRTPGTGLYDNLQQYKIPDPTTIFDISFFVRNPKPFFTLARELYPGRYQPNTVHYFVRLLQEKGVLLRNYTQNIDGLERLAGLRPGKLVEAHGSFSTASCVNCKTKQDSEQVKAMIFNGQTPRCKHKYCYGLVKPDIVFFGEDLPGRFHSLQLPDSTKCDLLVIMGTSLEVEPFASLASLPHLAVPRLLINREVVGPFRHHRKRSTDVAMTGDLVECVRELADIAGWTKELETLIKGVESDPSNESFVPPSTDLQLQSLSSSSATSPIPHDRRNRDGVIMEEELSSSLAQLKLQGPHEEMQFTKRHDGVQKNDGEPSVVASSTRQKLVKLHQHEERGLKEMTDGRGRRDNGIVQENDEQSSSLEGERTTDKLAASSEEDEEELDNEFKVLKWRISDVFSGLDNVSPKKKP